MQLEKVKELGKGGQGSVWLCIDRKTGEEYAAKFVNDQLWGENKGQECPLEREFDALSKLTLHPNIVKTKGLFLINEHFIGDQFT